MQKKSKQLLRCEKDKVILRLAIYSLQVVFLFVAITSYGYAQNDSQKDNVYGRLLYKKTAGKINYTVYTLEDAFASFWKQAKKVKIENIASKKQLTKKQLKKSKAEIKKLENKFEQEYLSQSNQQYKAKYNKQYEIWKSTIYKAGKSYWDFQIEKRLVFLQPLKADDVKKLMFERHLEVFKKQYPHDDFLLRARTAVKYIKYSLDKTFSFYSKQQDDVRVVIVPIDVQAVMVTGINPEEEAGKIKHAQSIMSLGMNLLSNLSFLGSLIPREYTQRVNFLKGGLILDQGKWIKEGKMFWGLWSKGLATYGVRAVVRNRNLKYLIPYKEYASGKYKEGVDTNIDPWLAFMFLAEYHKPYFVPDKINLLKMWFGNDSRQLREDLPPAIGYYLGYKVRFVILR